MRLDDAATAREIEEAQRRLAFAPHGMKRRREAELRELTHKVLRRDVKAATRRKRRRA